MCAALALASGVGRVLASRDDRAPRFTAFPGSPAGRLNVHGIPDAQAPTGRTFVRNTLSDRAHTELPATPDQSPPGLRGARGSLA